MNLNSLSSFILYKLSRSSTPFNYNLKNLIINYSMASSSCYVHEIKEETPLTSPEVASTSPLQAYSRDYASSSFQMAWSDKLSFFEKVTLKNNVGEVMVIKANCPIWRTSWPAITQVGWLTWNAERSQQGTRTQPDIHQAMLLQSSSTGSLITFSCNTMKARKALVWFVILKNFHFNTVKESDLENKLREGF